MEYYLFGILPPYDLFTRAKGPFGRVIGVGGYVAVQRCQDSKLFTQVSSRNKILYSPVYTSLCILNINSCTARVDVGSAYLQSVMKDSACPSSLHKNRSFSRGVTYVQREASGIGFSCGSLKFKAAEIVAQTSTKAAHVSWKMDFSILISTRVTMSGFLCLFIVYSNGGLSLLNNEISFLSISRQMIYEIGVISSVLGNKVCLNSASTRKVKIVLMTIYVHTYL